MEERAVRHSDRRRWPGRPRCWVPPGEARPRVRDPGRWRASRRLLAQPLGLAPTVHPGPLRLLPAGLGVPRSVLVVPHEGRRGRLLRGLRRALRASRSEPASVRTGSRESGALVLVSGDLRSRPTTWSWRPARTRTPGSLPSRARWIRASCSCTSEYRKPSQLQEGDTLVVGAGNSGAEIALEASREHRVLLSGRDTGQEPARR